MRFVLSGGSHFNCRISYDILRRSDDEGSTAATDGSTLRTSPAEAGGSAASDSGGSAADSIGGVSGRSSAYGNIFFLLRT